LRRVEIDHIDGAEFVARWAHAGTFVYADPPYVASSRKGSQYAHEMSDVAHRALAAALHAAVERGARVAVSGYRSTLYAGLYKGWRRVEFTVDPKVGQKGRAKGRTRTECLWMSYAATDELGYVPQGELFPAPPEPVAGDDTARAPAVDAPPWLARARDRSAP
jgi:DNA adenine methylase